MSQGFDCLQLPKPSFWYVTHRPIVSIVGLTTRQPLRALSSYYLVSARNPIAQCIKRTIWGFTEAKITAAATLSREQPRLLFLRVARVLRRAPELTCSVLSVRGQSANNCVESRLSQQSAGQQKRPCAACAGCFCPTS